MTYLKSDKTLPAETQLWRYMDITRFMAMLQTGSIWLARADTFKDQQEGLFPDQMREWIAEAYRSFDSKDLKLVAGVDDFQGLLAKNTFVSCWHMSDEESMVMWEIYGRGLEAVAIRTTVGNLQRCAATWKPPGHSLLLKPVIYANAADVTGVLPYEECIFRKRPHFAFEREVRLSLDTYDRRNPRKLTPRGHALPVSIDNLAEIVLVHPDCGDWFLELVRGITTRYGLQVAVERGAVGNV